MSFQIRWMYDASDPNFIRPQLYAVAGYIGGDTPHVWTQAEWRMSGNALRLPIFTASNREDNNAAAITDGATIRQLLAELGVPHGKTVAVDIETRVYSDYLDELNEQLLDYKLMPYGSISALVQNPPCSGGRWGADWTDDILTGVRAVESGLYNALQWADDIMLHKPYDLSVIRSDVPLWTP